MKRVRVDYLIAGAGLVGSVTGAIDLADETNQKKELEFENRQENDETNMEKEKRVEDNFGIC